MSIPPRISRAIQNHFVSILGVVAICILLFVFILPAQNQVKRIQEEVAATKDEIKSHQSALSLLQNKLASLRQTQAERIDQFQELESELDALQAQLGEKIIFHLPDTGPFPLSTDMLPQVMKKMADKQGLQEVIIDLQEPIYAPDWPSIAVTITAYGSLPNFRAFLIHLLETPYVAEIDELQLASCKSGICLDMKISIRLEA